MSTGLFCFKILLYLCFMVSFLSFHQINDISGSNHQIVMVLDMSAGMQIQNRIVKLKLAVQEWIIELVPNGVFFSIVEISSYFAKALCHLTEVNRSTRMEFVQLISENAVGESCIGCGLRMAVQELHSITENSVIIFVCGNENQEPGEDIQDVLKEEKLMGRVVAVALGNSAPKEELKLLANLTQGLFFEVPDDGGAEDLKTTFQAALDLLMTNLDIKNEEVNKTESASLNLMTTSLPTEVPSRETVWLNTHDQHSYTINSSHVVVWLATFFVFVIIICSALFVCTLRKHYLNRGFYHVSKHTSAQLL